MTLVQDLKSIDNFVGISKVIDSNVAFDSESIKKQYLTKYFETNPFAEKVAKGEQSYLNTIQFIYEEKGSFWKDFFASKNKLYDDKVYETIKAINEVGVVDINPESYTKKSLRNIQKGDNRAAGLTASLLTAFVTISRLNEMGMKEQVTTNDYAASIATVLFAGVAGFTIIKSMTHNFNRKNDSDKFQKLQKSAVETDKYLRNNYYALFK